MVTSSLAITALKCGVNENFLLTSPVSFLLLTSLGICSRTAASFYVQSEREEQPQNVSQDCYDDRHRLRCPELFPATYSAGDIRGQPLRPGLYDAEPLD